MKNTLVRPVVSVCRRQHLAYI